MPMGKYRNFKSCVASVSRRRGKRAVGNARAYCGRIYWRTEGKSRRRSRGK